MSKLREFRFGRIEGLSSVRVKNGFEEFPEQTADGLDIAHVEQKVKIEIPFILYLGAGCSIVLLGLLLYHLHVMSN